MRDAESSSGPIPIDQAQGKVVTFASDQNQHPEKLSPTSQRMLALREEVFAEWEKRVRNTVEQASRLRQPILINTLPTFYDNIAESITPDYPRESAISTTTIATEHGGERARLTNYDPKAIIVEYQTLRDALLDVLERNGVHLTEAEMRTINTSIDGGIRESVTSYVVAVSALRERFMAALMHDLRNPLAAASIGAELIARTAQSPDIKAVAEKIINNHRRMDEMLHDLLDAIVFHNGGRLQLDLSSFDILELLQDVCAQAAAAHGPRFQLVGAPVQVIWSKPDIRRALENLIGNAVKYGAPGTSISIKIACFDGRCLLSVHNEGQPIPAEEVEDIFQIFQRARAAKEGKAEGWGIGLPYVRAVAESHGGSSMMDSSAERGTTFSIDIPVDARPFQDAFTISTG